jgi:hypothetical protein
MTADPTLLNRIHDRLIRALSAGGPDQLRAPFRVSEIVQSLVPYRTYRNELGVDTLQDYEHAVLEMLAGEQGWLVCDPDTVNVIRKELASPDPDTGLLRRIQTAEVRVGAVRMPIGADVRPPVARPEDDAPARAVDRPGVVSDAIAIGAVMDREDAELARSEQASGSSAPAAATTAAVSTAAVPTAQTDVAAAAPARTSPAHATPAHAAPAHAASAHAAQEPLSQATGGATAALASVADLPQLVPPLASPASPSANAPLHQAHGVTIANASTLSRITPLSVPSVYGDPIDFRGVRHAPVDVGGVIFLFGMVARELGFNVEAMSSGYPRCEAKRQIAPGKWARLRIEFELESRQFRDAGRNPAACDLVVCWRDTWPDRPSSLDVLPLERALQTLSARE